MEQQRNKSFVRELSIGSIVAFYDANASQYICLVKELKEQQVVVFILDIHKNDIGSEPEFKTGIKKKLPVDRICGVMITEESLRKIGFIESDERAWKLMYYCGDMRLYYKYDKLINYPRFKFQPDFTQKRWIRIECIEIHKLQSVMRFLTFGKMEFEYKIEKKKKCNE